MNAEVPDSDVPAMCGDKGEVTTEAKSGACSITGIVRAQSIRHGLVAAQE